MPRIRTLAEVKACLTSTKTRRAAAKRLGVAESTLALWVQQDGQIKAVADEQKRRSRLSAKNSFCLPLELEKKLVKAAAEKGITKSAFIVEALEAQLEKKRSVLG